MRAPGVDRSVGARVALHAAAVLSLTVLPMCAAADSGGVSDAWIVTMVRRHCAMCHSENPSHTMLLGQQPPKGVVLEFD